MKGWGRYAMNRYKMCFGDNIVEYGCACENALRLKNIELGKVDVIKSREVCRSRKIAIDAFKELE